MSLFAVNVLAAIDTTTVIWIVVLGLLLVLLFVYPSFTNKKRQKQITELYKSVNVGDKIKTVGGVIGTVIQINEISALDSEVVLETGTGDNKTTIVFDMQAVYQNLTKMAQRSVPVEENKSDDKPSETESNDEATNGADKK